MPYWEAIWEHAEQIAAQKAMESATVAILRRPLVFTIGETSFARAISGPSPSGGDVGFIPLRGIMWGFRQEALRKSARGGLRTLRTSDSFCQSRVKALRRAGRGGGGGGGKFCKGR